MHTGYSTHVSSVAENAARKNAAFIRTTCSRRDNPTTVFQDRNPTIERFLLSFLLDATSTRTAAVLPWWRGWDEQEAQAKSDREDMLNRMTELEQMVDDAGGASAYSGSDLKENFFVSQRNAVRVVVTWPPLSLWRVRQNWANAQRRRHRSLLFCVDADALMVPLPQDSFVSVKKHFNCSFVLSCPVLSVIEMCLQPLFCQQTWAPKIHQLLRRNTCIPDWLLLCVLPLVVPCHPWPPWLSCCPLFHDTSFDFTFTSTSTSSCGSGRYRRECAFDVWCSLPCLPVIFLCRFVVFVPPCREFRSMRTTQFGLAAGPCHTLVKEFR